MKKYLALPRIDRQDDPIKWWFEIGKAQFPMLFQGAGNVITNKRASLGTQLVNELVTLSHNLE